MRHLFEDEEEDSEGEESIFVDRGSSETPSTEGNTIPKQYSNQDMKQMRKHRSQDIDDDTI